MRIILTLVASVVIGFSLAVAASAQLATQCLSVDQLIKLLADTYGEEQVAGGIAGREGVAFLIFARPDGSTWTAVAVLPDGRACMTASGIDWSSKTPTLPGSEI